MKIKYLGTAAAEGIPALFCACETCKKAAKAGGKEFRSRTQALIDDSLLIDYPPDTLMHCFASGIDLSKINHCLITHSHSDHMYLNDFSLLKPGYSHRNSSELFRIYASEENTLKINGYINSVEAKPEEFMEIIPVYPYIESVAGDFKVTPLEAVHGHNSAPLIYIIENGEGKKLLYAHDTNYFAESVWKYIEESKTRLDFVSLDCTQANDPEMKYIGHMNLADNIKVKKRLSEMGAADEKTVFCCNHFSHNGAQANYAEFEPIAKEHGFLTSYDGMTVEF